MSSITIKISLFSLRWVYGLSSLLFYTIPLESSYNPSVIFIFGVPEIIVIHSRNNTVQFIFHV